MQPRDKRSTPFESLTRDFQHSNAAVHGAVIVQSGASQEWHLYFLTDEKVWFF
jgi:hypothetical protein